MVIIPNNNIKATLTEYLAKIPGSPAKDRGIKLGEDVAARVVKMRAADGSTARNAYRPVTEPGKYVPDRIYPWLASYGDDTVRAG